MSTTINWFKISDSIESLIWQPNNMCVVEVNTKKITLAKQNNVVVAFAYKCPHAGGILADGFIDAFGNVVCPLHRYKFNTENGRNTTGEGYYVKTFKVENRVDGIYVGFEQKGFLGFI